LKLGLGLGSSRGAAHVLGVHLSQSVKAEPTCHGRIVDRLHRDGVRRLVALELCDHQLARAVDTKDI
jgi:hypothetical protein